MSYSGIWDGFDHYTTTGERWDTISGTLQYSTAYARFAAAAHCVGQGCRIPSACYKIKNYSSNVASPIVSTAFFLEAFVAGGEAGYIQFYDAGTIQLALAVTSAGALQVWRGKAFTGTLLGATSPGLITLNTWFFIDFIAVIATGTGGSFSVYLSTPKGGPAVLTVSSVNTSASGNAYANQVGIGDFNNASTPTRWDDFHAHDAGGSAPNAILGEGSRIYTKLPTGAGALTNWTPNGASANWQCVDEVPPDDNTSYVSSTTMVEDNYAVGAAGFTGTVNGLVRRSRIAKNDASAHTFQAGVRSGSTDQLGTAVTVPSSFAYFDVFSSIDPNTSAAWLAAGADAATMSIYEAS
jgi:hypothetical protein